MYYKKIVFAPAIKYILCRSDEAKNILKLFLLDPPVPISMVQNSRHIQAILEMQLPGIPPVVQVSV